MDHNDNDISMVSKEELIFEKEKDNLKTVKSLELTIKEFQNNFKILNDNYSLNDIEKVLNPVEYADYNSFLAYSICSLFYSYLKISGNLNNHPIKNELKRVQSFMREIKEKNLENSEEKRLHKINKEASKRIVDSCVSYNQNMKKRKY